MQIKQDVQVVHSKQLKVTFSGNIINCSTKVWRKKENTKIDSKAFDKSKWPINIFLGA